VIRVDCLCPPSGGAPRHPDGDTITLREKLDFRTAATIQHAISVLRLEEREPQVEEVLARLTEAYVRYGIASWSLVDEAGAPIPVSPQAVDAYLFSNLTAAMIVGDEADERFSGAILLPLLQRASTSSPATPTTDETSPPTGSPESPAPPTPLRPSSTTTTPTDGTATTSRRRAGASRSSPSSASVA